MFNEKNRYTLLVLYNEAAYKTGRPVNYNLYQRKAISFNLSANERRGNLIPSLWNIVSSGLHLTHLLYGIPSANKQANNNNNNNDNNGRWTKRKGS